MRSSLCVFAVGLFITNGVISACTYVPPTAANVAGAGGSGSGSSSSGLVGEGGGGAGGNGSGVGGGGGGAGGEGGGVETGGGGSAPEIFLDWVGIPSGAFEMGSTASVLEQPIHYVTIPGFELTRAEITVAEYMQCVSAGACLPPANINPSCYWPQPGFEQYPVNCVSWDNSAAFCKWAGARLPSEAEWEYAARSSGQLNTFPWGADTPTCDYAVMLNCALTTPEPVCTKLLGHTVEGLCDMAGNVYEWVQDSWHVDYNGAPVDGSAWEGTTQRMVRGGGFNSSFNQIRTSWRALRYNPTHNDIPIGFRCAR